MRGAISQQLIFILIARMERGSFRFTYNIHSQFLVRFSLLLHMRAKLQTKFYCARVPNAAHNFAGNFASLLLERSEPEISQLSKQNYTLHRGRV